jgi:hypothetical protein
MLGPAVEKVPMLGCVVRNFKNAVFLEVLR